MPRANTIGRLTVLFLVLGTGCALKGKKSDRADTTPATSVGATSATPNGSATAAGDKPPGSPATFDKTAELNRVMGELQSLGALDPKAQAQLMTDLEQTDPNLWPQVVQAFRASMAYRQRANAAKPGAMAKAPAAPDPAASPDLLPIATSGALPGEQHARAAAPAVAVQLADVKSVAKEQTPNAPANINQPGEVQQVSHEEPIDDDKDEDWNRQVAEAIHSLESAQAGKKSLGTAEQVYLRMLYLAAGRRDDAVRPVPGLPATEQDFGTEQLYGMSTYLDAARSPDARQRSAEAHLHLTKATGRLAEANDLVVRNLAFCTEVHSYGMYTPFPKAEFRPGQQVLLYAEVENFKTEPSPKGFHTALKSSYQILDPQGKRVMEHDLGATEEFCQNARHDYFIRYFLSVPSRIYDGTYTLQLTIEDKLAGKIGQSTIEFTAKEKK
jgi:hypothetical protein